ncbi:MAG: nucleotidyltransferase family protein [Burkholderiales bacterium]|nr:nucleotidyltransferase family protein [Burkholderiales bacterium]
MNRPWLQALGRPERCTGWSLDQWQEATRQLRRLRLLARLAEAVEAAGLGPAIPEPVAKLLLAERQTSRYRRRVVAWAATRIARTLQAVGAPLVLLKGSAYLAQELPIAPGRLPSDLDILVPRDALERAQRMLVADGWQEPELDAHDRRYYHEWSHEVPPMQHPMHPIELDLHHNILPPLGPVAIDMALLLRDARPSAWPGWSVLAPVDQVLHSAAHLFFDSEPLERVRDLVDLDGLLRHHGARDAGFGAALEQRAQALGLMEPLLLACHFCSAWLETPLGPTLTQRLQRVGWRERGLRALFAAVLTPAALDRPRPLRQRLAAAIVLWRYHLRRMPLRLLVPHLWHKLRKPRADATPG